MADTNLVVSVANVLPQSTYGRPIYNNKNRAGSTITAGTLVYLNASTVWAATTTATAIGVGSGTIWGIAANGASSGQYLIVQTSGGIKLNTSGSSLIAVGEYYRASQLSAGGIASMSGFPVQTGAYTGIVGYGAATDIITMAEVSNGVAHA